MPFEPPDIFVCTIFVAMPKLLNLIHSSDFKLEMLMYICFNSVYRFFKELERKEERKKLQQQPIIF
jgi:hypothetical protein